MRRGFLTEVTILQFIAAFIIGFIVSQIYYLSSPNDSCVQSSTRNIFHDVAPVLSFIRDEPAPAKIEEKAPNESPIEKVDPYKDLDFSECNRLQKDRSLKVFVHLADERLVNLVMETKSKPFLAKLVTNQSPKLLFFMGLEGTGHHLIDQTFKGVCTMVNETKITPCRAATHVIANFVGNIGPKWDFLQLSRNLSKHGPFIERIREQMAMTSQVMFLNSMRHHHNIFLDSANSYPDGGHPRIDNYPDVRFLAEIFTQNSMDFNIVLMLRDIDALMVSTVVNRGFEQNFYNQAHIFEYMLQQMVAQLSNLDSKFIAGCIKLDAQPHIMDQYLSQLDQRFNCSAINFRKSIMENWRFKPKKPCIHPDDLDTKILYRLITLNAKLHSFCPI